MGRYYNGRNSFGEKSFLLYLQNNTSNTLSRAYMNNPKYPSSLYLLLPLFFLLSACGTNRPPEKATPISNPNDDQLSVQLYVYTPKNMLDDNVISELIEGSNITLVQEYYRTDQELISIVSQPPRKISLIVASNYAASVLIDQSELAPLDPTGVPNVINIDGRFRNLAYDPNNQYCAAYTYGTLGIGYINGQAPVPASWGDLFRQPPESPAYGRVTLLDHPREAMGAALIHLGYDPNTSTASEINEAKQLIIEAADSFTNVNSLSYWEDLAAFKTTLAQGFSRDFLAGQQINAEMNYLLPPEGTLIRTYNLCIPKTAPPDHKRAAEIFINMVLMPEWATVAVPNLELPTTILVDEEQIALDTRQNPLIYPPNEILNNVQYVYSLGPQEILYTTAWEDILNAIH